MEDRVEKHRWIRRIVVYICFGIGLMILVAGGVQLYREQKTAESLPELVDTVEAEELLPDTGFIDVACRIGNGDAARDSRLYLTSEIGYFFLPSYADMSALTLVYDETRYRVSLDGREMPDGTRIRGMNPDDLCPVMLTRTDNGETRSLMVRFYRSEGMPTLYIDTASGSMEALDEDKEYRESAELLVLSEHGDAIHQTGVSSMHSHGHSTWKRSIHKSYNVKLEEPAALLGMHPAEEWILISNGLDETKIRNATAYTFAQDLGLPYAVEYRYADVWFNGRYWGNYLVCSKVETATGRVEPQEVEALLQVNGDIDTGNYLACPGYQNMIIEYPSEPAEEDRAFWEERVNRIVALAQYGSTKQDTERLLSYMDLDSFARMYLIHAFLDEPDMGSRSTYYYFRASDRRLCAGPAWDFDYHFGGREKYRWPVYDTYRKSICEWLLDQPVFLARVQSMLEEQEWAVDAMMENIATYAEKLEKPAKMTYARFGPLTRTRLQTGNWDADVESMRIYAEERVALIKDTIRHPERYHKVTIDNRIYWLKAGTRLPEQFREDLCAQYGYDHLAYTNGMTFIPEWPIEGDIILHGVSATTDEGGANDEE